MAMSFSNVRVRSSFLILVKQLRVLGEIFGVTGDGTIEESALQYGFISASSSWQGLRVTRDYSTHLITMLRSQRAIMYHGFSYFSTLSSTPAIDEHG